MPDQNAPISLGLNSREPQNVPPPEDLQFEQAVSTATGAPVRMCLLCKAQILSEYFHAQGQPVCCRCKAAIEAGQQRPPAHTLMRAGLYGAGAALGGSALFAIVTIVTGYELALISILIGFMVGKAVRTGSRGLGGRPQQILAVALTYFSITGGYVPVFIYHAVQKNQAAASGKPASGNAPAPRAVTTTGQSPKLSFVAALGIIFAVALAAPFLSLSAGVSGILTLLIVFFGLQQAWRLTRRVELVITGPYSAAATA